VSRVLLVKGTDTLVALPALDLAVTPELDVVRVCRNRGRKVGGKWCEGRDELFAELGEGPGRQ
jgi:hypothetical protein